MYLLIDSSQKNTTHLVLFNNTMVSEQTYSGVHQDVLAHVDSFLKKYTLHSKEISGIAVVVGAGTFTATRVATTIANTFAFVYRIPLVAIFKKESEDFFGIHAKFEYATPGQYISATYSGEPNIQIKKIV